MRQAAVYSRDVVYNMWLRFLYVVSTNSELSLPHQLAFNKFFAHSQFTCLMYFALLFLPQGSSCKALIEQSLFVSDSKDYNKGFSFS